MPLIIFDCDGVLVESEAIYLRAELEFLNQVRLTFEPDVYMSTYMGMAPDEWQASLSRLHTERLGDDLEPGFFTRLAGYVREQFEQQLVAVEGARQAITRLEHPRCVASSSLPELLAWKLAHTGLDDLFEPHLFSTSLVSRGKPEPDLFLFAAEAMGHSATDCIVVEDSANGVQAGKSAGMTTVGFTAATHCAPGHEQTLRSAGADVIVGAYGELERAITRLV